MPEFFLLVALILAIAVTLLYYMPHLKLLNIVDYGEGAAVERLNRYTAVRLLIPVAVNLASAYVASIRPELTVPLVILTPISILCAVICISAGARTAKARA